MPHGKITSVCALLFLLHPAARGDCDTAGTPSPAPEVYRVAAECYLRSDRVPEAISILRQGIAAGKAPAVLERMLGEILLRQDSSSGEAGELLRRASTALATDPESKHYYAQWAYLNAHDKICASEETVALRSPGLNDAALLQMYTLLGMCQSRLQQVEEAKASFRKAHAVNIRQSRFDPVAAWQYVQLLSRLGETQQVQRISDEILARVPAFAPAHLERAKFFDRSGQPQQAIEAANETLRGEANDANTERAAHAILARCYLVTGDRTAAEREQQWIEKHPNPETIQ
jgi:tetratricopeptide (TPR) repeat protein